MAATESPTFESTARSSGRRRLGSIVLAACALPGVMIGPAARAEEAPEKGLIELKYSSYKEWQDGSSSSKTSGSTSSDRITAQGLRSTISAASGSSGGTTGGSTSTGSSTGSVSSASHNVDRIHVSSPSIRALVPLGRQWAAEGALTVDRISGASPAYYTDTSSFARMTDRRTAGDLKLTRYFDRQAVSFGMSRSKESDYLSNAFSTEARFSSADHNTTLNLGVGLTRDTIDPSNGVVSNARKQTHEFQVGVTQAVSAMDLVQLTYTRSVSHGYLNDPYKSWDNRPDLRDANILLGRWNHWLGSMALKTSYRYYQDTYHLRAHTFDVALAMPLGNGITFTPSLRYYMQNAASFFVPPNTSSSTYPQPSDTSGYYSLDQRLSAFGAFTVAGKLEFPIAKDWSADTKLSYYRQAAGLRLGGGTSGLSPLNAFFWQLGLQHPF